MIAASSVTIRNLMSPDFTELLGFVFLHTLWLFAALAVVARLLLQSMRHASSNARYYTALFVLAGMTVSPLAIGVLLLRSVSAEPAQSIPGHPEKNSHASSPQVENHAQPATQIAQETITASEQQAADAPDEASLLSSETSHGVAEQTSRGFEFASALRPMDAGLRNLLDLRRDSVFVPSDCRLAGNSSLAQNRHLRSV